MVIVLFSFGGVQFLGVAAADAEETDKTVPKAINGVVLRIIIFYIGTLLAIVCLYPWQAFDSKLSPFIDVFDKVGFHFAAQIMSIVVITAALSAFNSCLYSAARMLANLAKHKAAPAFLGKTNQQNIPQNAVIITSIFIAITVGLNYLMPEQILMYLVAITTTSIIITWNTILISHTGFRRQTNQALIKYKLPFYPYLNVLMFFCLASVLVIMCFMPDMRIAIYMMPVWIGIASLLYWLQKNYSQQKNIADMPN